MTVKRNKQHTLSTSHLRLRQPFILCVAFIALSFVGCAEKGNEESNKDAERSRTIEYEWYNGVTPAGEQTVSIGDDGKRQSTMRLQWNNRDFVLNNTMQFDDSGYVTQQHLTGTSAFGATIDELFSIKEKIARWKNPSEEGEKVVAEPAYYVPARSGATETLAGLIRVGLKSPNGTVALLPSGEASIKKLADEAVRNGNMETTVSLYAITGLEFAPTYVWLDEDQNFFAFTFWGMSLAPKGWGANIREQLHEAQTEIEERYYNNVAAERVENPAGRVQISNVDIVDVETGSLLLEKNVLIENGVITAIDEIQSKDADIRTIDGSGKTLIPGFWDMHGHIEFFGNYGGIFNIAGGVTSVRDMGSDHDALMRSKNNFLEGRLVGPHVYAAGFIDQKSPFAETRAVETLEEAKQKVAWYADNGYGQIKLYSSIAPEWVAPLSDLALEKGIRVGGHIPAFMSAEQAVHAGYDEISHINFLFLNFLADQDDDTRTRLRFYLYGDEAGNLDLDGADVQEFISLLASEKIVVDPTIAVFDSMIGHHAGKPNPLFTKVIDGFPIGEYRSALSPSFDITSENEQAWSNSQRNSLEFIRRLHDGGVQILAGTDALPGFAFHRELELYAEAGIPNADILKIATIDAARVTGEEKVSGSIKVGKRADMVLLNSNPLEDISAVRDIEYVFAHDKIYDPKSLLTAVGVKPVN
ncbi:amidohydrolase family protein [Hyphococcus lacteus]|uniref:Amidohydrolase family protein n=1 Tax=Hyphococcus lacteus TaxID=3143536 RepID=A0ABV3Z6U9_9PROT